MHRRYTYGPVQMSKAAYTGKYALLFQTSYWDSSVEIKVDNQLASIDPANLTLPGGHQYNIRLQSTNHDSDISLEYELIVIRPYPECSSGQLSQWLVSW